VVTPRLSVDGEGISMAETDRLHLSDREWRERLSEERYHILRSGGTEPPFSGPHVRNHRDGVYRCGGCGEPLFDSSAKFESGSGWPSFTQPRVNAVTEHADASSGLRRVEIRCARCGGHLGHVFPDGPGPTGLRYCINSLALDFDEKDMA
jgi:peptide-methionine (R)-S-oxide reductase